eukprot:m.3020 g.3020  ORF g.3020 m.3020 type:complete len:235 (+) comp4345_c0_seq1:101-805(+)
MKFLLAVLASLACCTLAQECDLTSITSFSTAIQGCATTYISEVSSCGQSADCVCDGLQSYVGCFLDEISQNPCIPGSVLGSIQAQFASASDTCDLISQFTLDIETSVPSDFSSLTQAQLEALCIQVLDNGGIANTDYSSDDVSITYSDSRRRADTIDVKLVYRGAVPPAVADITGEDVTGLKYQNTDGDEAEGTFTPDTVAVASKAPGTFDNSATSVAVSAVVLALAACFAAFF